MSYLQFDKKQLINLEYSLSKEILRSNRAGSYASFTIIGCNTRKYHGLLVCPIDAFGGEQHVLLSSLDTTVIQRGKEFNLGIHKFEGDVYEPRGHKYFRDFYAETIPQLYRRVGGVVLLEEKLLVERKEQLLVKFTLLEAHSDTWLRFKPFLAFRNKHALTHANMYANTKVQFIENGVRIRMYEGFPYLHMQLNKPADFIPVPHWFYNIEYMREQERGYDYKEDLFVPGYFEIPIRKGESVIFSASTEAEATASLKRTFTYELKKRTPRNSFRHCLINSAQQFIKHYKGKTEIIAGFPWFDSWGRDTFISLPGLTLTLGNIKDFKAVMKTEISKMSDEGLFPNMGKDGNYAFNSVDAPLWFFWDVQQYIHFTGDKEGAWKLYGKVMKRILETYRRGTDYNIGMHENALIWAGEPGKALTWMDAVVEGVPVTPRTGFPVEINALWYNAVSFCLSLAEEFGDYDFTEKWKNLPGKIKDSFMDMFWDEERKYLADFVSEKGPNWQVRPNQVIATSLPYSPLDDGEKQRVLRKVEKQLLTPRGLRTLSPEDPEYKGRYHGDQAKRDRAYHQGTVWPWLLGPYCEGVLKLYKRSAVSKIRKLIWGFEKEMMQHGIGSISEIYDGDPPHEGKGAISQAWSVSEVLRVLDLLDKTETE
ncbi:MAG: glycogen debranching enzyme family protein [Bacteroidales bacterium]|nr:glycogen debranching enzyme family protein [Bacteroidales bacterium]